MLNFMFSIPCIMDQFIRNSQQDVTSQYFISCYSLRVSDTERNGTAISDKLNKCYFQ
jgi:hypothetical protein